MGRTRVCIVLNLRLTRASYSCNEMTVIMANSCLPHSAVLKQTAYMLAHNSISSNLKDRTLRR